jgi:thermostable 8-oxoguanine DNA glycosylase
MANVNRDLVSSINNSVVAQIKEHAPEVITAMRHAVNRHYDNIRAELDVIASLSNVDRARFAMVFSIISPQCPFAKNVKVTPPLLAAIMNHATEDEFRTILVANGIGLQNAKARAIADAAHFIRDITSESVTRDLLMKVRGISMKASAMTIALFDENAPIYTLDTHMLRGIMQVCGLHEKGTYTITTAAYRELETWLVELAQNECNDASVFLTQWALWNEFGFKGEHQIHTPIFGM